MTTDQSVIDAMTALFEKSMSISGDAQQIIIKKMSVPNHGASLDDQIIFALFLKSHSIASSFEHLMSLTKEGLNPHIPSMMILNRSLFELANKLHYLEKHRDEISSLCLPAQGNPAKYRKHMGELLAEEQNKPVNEVIKLLDEVYGTLSGFAHADVLGTLIMDAKSLNRLLLDTLASFLLIYSELLRAVNTYCQFFDEELSKSIIAHYTAVSDIRPKIVHMLKSMSS